MQTLHCTCTRLKDPWLQNLFKLNHLNKKKWELNNQHTLHFQVFWASRRYRCLRKKYGVADYRYFKNGNTQQYNTLRHTKYNFRFCFFCFVLCLCFLFLFCFCEISTPDVKRNESYEVEKNYGFNGTQTTKRQIYTQVLFDPPFHLQS